MCCKGVPAHIAMTTSGELGLLGYSVNYNRYMLCAVRAYLHTWPWQLQVNSIRVRSFRGMVAAHSALGPRVGVGCVVIRGGVMWWEGRGRVVRWGRKLWGRYVDTTGNGMTWYVTIWVCMFERVYYIMWWSYWPRVRWCDQGTWREWTTWLDTCSRLMRY